MIVAGIKAVLVTSAMLAITLLVHAAWRRVFAAELAEQDPPPYLGCRGCTGRSRCERQQ